MSQTASDSLSSALDSLAESLFLGRKISAARRAAAARWIADRQGLPGSYAAMFAPTARDMRGIRLFTGEAVRSRAGISHLLGEEAVRILSALRVDDRRVQDALGRAIGGMAARLEESEQRGFSTGIYCCGTCAAGYWRNLALGLFPRSLDRLRLGLEQLKQLRLADGTWCRFPFHYTSLALTEIGPDLAGAEMKHAARRWSRLLPRLGASSDPLSVRRAAVGKRLLDLCES